MKICIDAGHSGYYANKGVSAGYVESVAMWNYHLLLKAELEKYGVEVVTTRKTINENPSLEKRGNTAKGCDLFISCHSNAYDYTDQNQADKTTRTCVIYSIPYAQETKGVADAIGEALANLFKEFDANTYAKTYQRQYPNKPNVDYYGVIRGAANVGVGGIIVEHSFHTSRPYCEWAMKEGNLQRMAEVEAGAIAKFYGLTKEPELKPMYRVQLGAFRNRTYALNFLKEVQKTFPDAFIKTSLE
jgi:N-acetylmuramoyl-L-alanine amidase